MTPLLTPAIMTVLGDLADITTSDLTDHAINVLRVAIDDRGIEIQVYGMESHARIIAALPAPTTVSAKTSTEWRGVHHHSIHMVSGVAVEVVWVEL